jgi:hypothetical protein
MVLGGETMDISAKQQQAFIRGVKTFISGAGGVAVMEVLTEVVKLIPDNSAYKMIGTVVISTVSMYLLKLRDGAKYAPETAPKVDKYSY